MRLFGKVNSTIDRFDRAAWMTGGFDLAFSEGLDLMAITIDVAEAVKDALAAGSYSIEFTPVRAYVPEFTAAEVKTIKVVVVPITQADSLVARTTMGQTIQVQVGVVLGVDDLTNATLDPLMDFIEELGDSLWKSTYDVADDTAEAKWIKSENAPIYDAVALRDKRQFASLITLTYSVYRAVA